MPLCGGVKDNRQLTTNKAIVDTTICKKRENRGKDRKPERKPDELVTTITKRQYVLEYKGVKQKIHGWRIMAIGK
jgi:hypothetical protein